MFYRYWFNWGVYEEDIIFLGGSVEYSGIIIKRVLTISSKKLL